MILFLNNFSNFFCLIFFWGGGVKVRHERTLKTKSFQSIHFSNICPNNIGIYVHITFWFGWQLIYLFTFKIVKPLFLSFFLSLRVGVVNLTSLFFSFTRLVLATSLFSCWCWQPHFLSLFSCRCCEPLFPFLFSS